MPALPASLICIAPLAPVPAPLSGRVRLYDVPGNTPEDVQALLAELAPRFIVPVDADIHPEGGLTVAPRTLACLTESGVDGCVEEMAQIAEALQAMEDGADAGMVATRIPWLRPLLPTPGEASPTDSSEVDDLLSMVDTGSASTNGTDPLARLKGLHARMRGAVTSHPLFKDMARAWHGLAWLAARSGDVRLRAVAIGAEVFEDVVAAVGDQLAGDDAPVPTAILCDADLHPTPRGIGQARALASLADAMLCMACVHVGPTFFAPGAVSWQQARGAGYLPRIFEAPRFSPFHSLFKKPEGSLLAVIAGNVRTDDVQPGGPEARSVWAVGGAIAASVSRTGWPSSLMNARVEGAARFLEQHTVEELSACNMIALRAGTDGEHMHLTGRMAASGAPLAPTLFLSGLMATLDELRLQGGEATGPQAVQEALGNALGIDDDPAASLSVSQADSDEGLVLEIGITPPARVTDAPGRFTFTYRIA